uniref:Uncharacterized protein n=1 Tax=Anguilla anguilla TaxID=7936 RepID=A0A0E9PHX7_ANGAN
MPSIVHQYVATVTPFKQSGNGNEKLVLKLYLPVSMQTRQMQHN